MLNNIIIYLFNLIVPDDCPDYRLLLLCITLNNSILSIFTHKILSGSPELFILFINIIIFGIVVLISVNINNWIRLGNWTWWKKYIEFKYSLFYRFEILIFPVIKLDKSNMESVFHYYQHIVVSEKLREDYLRNNIVKIYEISQNAFYKIFQNQNLSYDFLFNVEDMLGNYYPSISKIKWYLDKNNNIDKEVVYKLRILYELSE